MCLVLAACAPPPSAGADAGADAGAAAVADEAPATAPDPALPGLRGDAELQAKLDASLAAKGPDYAPRSRHLRPDGQPVYTNRLIAEASPYLLQHAHNPINWFAWGEQVFERALREDKPVLLSIGYSTCHWCHVMERESFEDEELAAWINQHYLAIKVDREQRPDLDEVYMRAVQLLSGRGGWPMTVVLTPERQPFFGGTYFPPDRRGRPGFRAKLEQLERAYRDDPGAVVEQARELSERLAASASLDAGRELPEPRLIRLAAAAFGRRYDDVNGGFGSAPKFPRPANLELLMRHSRRSGDERALARVRGTLDGILAGGIHDHVGGGFHRYATDDAWLVPHFEKMLYDNAQLVVVLLEAYQSTGEARYADVARETLDYLAREMSAASGGFYSATDADSEVPSTGQLVPGTGQVKEGWFFTWTEAELDAALEPELAAAVRAYYMSSSASSGEGDFEGRNILHTAKTMAEVAAQLGVEEAELARSLAEARRVLYEVRARRPAPLRDDKLLSSWNGLAISAFARAAFVLDEPRYLDRARSAAQFLATRHIDGEGRLLRSSLGETLGARGYLDDYAFVIAGLLDLFEASAELRWLELAIALQAELDAHHRDDRSGAYFTTADDGEALIARHTPIYDGAEPSGNSVAALDLLRLYELTRDEDYRARATKLLAGLSSAAQRSPMSVPKLLCALDFALDQPLQIFVVTPPGADAPNELLEVIRRSFVPNRVVAIVTEDELAQLQVRVPALEHKLARDGQATAYVCEAELCKAPTSDPAVLAEQLAAPLSAATAER